ncbi:MAG: N-acetyltransferase [Candidatus Wallbacteria bacterium]|nr:N-acetyltransferase [Candidatus Wallbacteria bacterium]
MSQDVTHQPDRGCFVIPVDNGDEVLLEYRSGAGALDFYHTFVPESARGKGLAEKVVQAGFAFARSRGLRVIPTCSYIGTYLRKHPEDQDLIK